MHRFLTLASIIAAANAACDNACSGHGTCNYEDICTCFPNWRLGGEAAGDCSDRVCPYDVAWVDTPSLNSDIAMNGLGSVHRYAECSGRGLCDRETGLCGCFDGYTGDACQRTTCPNDCSGHGTCEFIEDLGYGANYGAYHDGQTFEKGFMGVAPKNFTSSIARVNYDAGKTRQCKCDPHYSGADCSLRSCPFGNDVLDKTSSNGNRNQKQRIHFVLDDGYAGNAGGSIALVTEPQAGTSSLKLVQNFALAFTSKLGERFVTRPIRIPPFHDGVASDATANADALKAFVETALEELPNFVIDDVTVTAVHVDDGVATDGTDGYVAAQPTAFSASGNAVLQIAIDIEFSGSSTQGNQYLLEVLTDECSSGNIRALDKDSGCTPQLNGVDLLEASVDGTFTAASVASKAFSSVFQIQASDLNSYECGRRGKCDYETGICQCFAGYKGAHCEDLTALL